MSWLAEIVEGMTAKQKAGLTLTWRAVMMLFIVLIYTAWSKYNENLEKTNEFLLGIQNDVAEMKKTEAITIEYRNFHAKQHEEMNTRMDKFEVRLEGAEKNIAEVKGKLK